VECFEKEANMGELKRVSKEDFQLTSKRNYSAEERAAQLSLLSAKNVALIGGNANDVGTFHQPPRHRTASRVLC
jgi:hypothetical protein